MVLAIPVVFALAAPGGAPPTGTVRDFGAIGDGVADDTTAIQRCIDAAPDGGEIRFPVGRYRVSKTLRLGKTLALIGEGAAYAMNLGDFGSPAYGTGYTWGAVIESTVADGPAIDHSPGRYTGLRIEHLSLTGVGDATRTGAGIRIAFPGGACEAGLSNVQISNFAIGLDAECVMHSGIDRLRVNGCDTGIQLRSGSNANTLANLSISNCGDGVVLDGAVKNTITGAIQGTLRTGVILRNNAEENSLRDVYFESSVGQLAIDVQASADATVIDSCHFGTTGDGVRIAANWCRIFSGKYVQAITLSGVGTQILGPWTGKLTDTGSRTLLIADAATSGITLDGGASLEFGDGRRWTPGGQVQTQTLYWLDSSGNILAAIWPQGKQFWCQTPGTVGPGRGGLNGNPAPRVTRLSQP
jgi:hypothetical protein